MPVLTPRGARRVPKFVITKFILNLQVNKGFQFEYIKLRLLRPQCQLQVHHTLDDPIATLMDLGTKIHQQAVVPKGHKIDFTFKILPSHSCILKNCQIRLHYLVRSQDHKISHHPLYILQ